LAGTISHAKLKVSSSGAQGVAQQLDQVGKATNRVGRAQTRLGQASASAGRQFAAQANGLGGLVAAYAGAAANIFAVTAAFAALSKAAKFDQVLTGTNALASSIGANGRDIINTVQQITKSQLNLLETAQTVNIGLAAGFNTTQIEKLSDVSLRASKALGRDLTDAFTRVSRGAAKLEPELLDELGIFTRIDPAVKKYADSLGRSVTSLTNFERRQAFANAVIEEGTRKFRDVDTSTKTTAESFEKLAATVVNLGLKFGSLLATVLAPLADFISGNLSNALGAFGILAGVIGSKAGEVLAGGLNKVSSSIIALGENAATFLNKFNSNFDAATKKLVEFNNANTLVIRSNSQLAQSLNQKLAQTQADIAAGKIKTKVELESARAVVQSAIAEGKAALARSTNRKSKIRQIAAIRVLIAENNRLTAAVNASSVASNLAGLATAGLAKGIGLVGGALASVVGRLLSFVTYISLAQLALDGLAKAFGFEGFNLLESLLSFIKDIIKFFTQFSANVTAFANSFKQDMMKAAEATGAFGADAESALKKATKEFNNLLIASRASEFVVVSDDLLSFENRILSLSKESPAAAAALQVLADEFVRLNATNIDVFQKIISGLTAVSSAAGLSTAQVRDFFQNVRGIEKVTASIDRQTGILSTTVDNVAITFQRANGDILVFKEGFLDIATTLTAGADKVNDFYEEFKKGTLDAEKAAAAVSAIGSSITSLDTQRERNLQRILTIESQLSKESVKQDEELKKKLETQRNDLTSSLTAIDASKRRLRIEQDIARVQSNRLTELERMGKTLDKIYGKPGEKIDRLVLSGELGVNAELARTARVREANAAVQLQTLVLAGKEVKAQEGLRILINDRAELTEKIRKKNKQLEESANNRFEQEKISDDLAKLREDLKIKELKLGSDNLEILKNSEFALKQLTLLQGTLVKLADEATSSEKELYAIRIKNYDLQLKVAELKEQKELQQTKTLITLEKQRLANQLEFRKVTGTLIGQDELGFSLAQGRLSITANAADKQFAINQAKRNEDRQTFALNQQKQQFEQDLKIRKVNLDATLRLIRALEANTLETTNALRAQQGLEPLSGAPERVDESGLTLSQRFKQAFSTYENLSRDNFVKQQEIITKEADLKRQAAEDSFLISKDATEKELALKIFQADETVKLFQRVNESLTGTVRESIEGFFNSIVEGTLTLESAKEQFRSFIFNILNGIREAVLEQTLIEPITNAVTNQLSRVFNLENIAGQANEQAAALTAQAQAQTASATIATAITTVGASFTTSALTLQATLQTSMAPVTTAFTAVGVQISAAITAMITQVQAAAAAARAQLLTTSAFAGGGRVHMAQGGMPNAATMKRDRVPAMLEPGEFVMRKDAVKQFGVGTMMRMNAAPRAYFKVAVQC
jgi:hypothetical protein